MTNFLKTFSTSSLLLAGALVGLTLSACDPKMIGNETQGDNDKACKEGEQMPSDDGCNTCTCTDGGWACTEKACEDPSGGPAICEDGESKPADDGCNTCNCENGDWSCTLINCADECQPGEKKMEDCNSCECYDGTWACTDAACPNETEGDTVDPGETEGETVGETEADTIDPTGEAVCGDGIVAGLEQCDDGNQIDDDGCTNACYIEQACGPKDPLEINTAQIVGDDLVAEVSYGGGCEEHLIGLCWDGGFAESDPEQTWISLTHDAQDDNCDAWITEMRVIDLSVMRDAYTGGDPNKPGDFIVHLEGWPEPLVYAF